VLLLLLLMVMMLPMMDDEVDIDVVGRQSQGCNSHSRTTVTSSRRHRQQN